MRRLFVLGLVTALATVLLAPAASAKSAQGDLMSSFRSEASRVFHPGYERPAGHIHVLFDFVPQEVCDETVVGAWYSTTSPVKSEVLMSVGEYTLDGEPLDEIRTPARQNKLDGEKIWVDTTGVPVIGTLDVGKHVLELDLDVEGDGVVDLHFALDIDVSSAYCD